MATGRSPSPNPSRAKTPDGSRKSTKPSVSIDPHLRNSCSKENERGAATVHSSGRAPKNFMAPTISAASKKKILRERNDEVSDSLETSNYTIESRNSVAVPSFSSPSPADAGADPSSSVPPYDPKTNYLSPRPQFLHYRPNPRIESYVSTEGEFLHEAGDGRRLDASFSSESEEEDKDSEEERPATPSVPSEVEEEEEEEEASGRETRAVAESKPYRPSLLPRRSKLAPFLLVVAIACVFVPLSDSPVISSSVPNDQSLTRLYSPPSGMYRDIAGAKLHDLASRFKRWSSDSVAYFSSATSCAGEVGLVGLVNMTSPAEDEAIGSDFIYKHEIGTEQGTEDELEVLEAASGGSAENEAEEKEMDVPIGIDDTKHEAESEATEMEASGAVNEVAEFETEMVLEEAVSEALDDDTDVLEENSATENVEYEAENVDMEFETEVPENGAANIEEDQISSAFKLATASSQAMVGLSAAFLLLVVAVAAFLHTKQKKTPIATEEMHTSGPAKGEEGSPLKHLRGNGDLVGDSGYSVASSGLDKTFSCGQHRRIRRGEEDDDSSSHGRRPRRRDSTESSSVSYGSFTTYERLSAKKGYKDEEVVVTPVRRSSRLRSRVTSS